MICLNGVITIIVKLIACSNVIFLRLVYWVTNDGNTATIERAQMNGEKREVVLRFPRRYHYYYYSPRALALDSDNNRLYWVDDNRGELCYTETNPKDGLIHNVGISSRYIQSPYSLALKEDYIYWGDELKSAVYRVNKTDTGKVKKIVSGVDPIDLHVYHNNTQVLGKMSLFQLSLLKFFHYISFRFPFFP